MPISTGGTLNAKLDIDRLCEAITASGNVDQVLPALKEHFPQVIWTRGKDGELRAAVQQGGNGYRP